LQRNHKSSHGSVLLESEGSAELSPPQIFRREGDSWTVMYAGTTVRLRDAIGMRYLAYLLAQPNEPIAVTALLAAVKGGERMPTPSVPARRSANASATACGASTSST
jgi:hypothetical protein